MKRLWTMLVALVLLFSVTAAHAAVGTITFGSESEDAGKAVGYAQAAAFVKDTVYFVAYPTGTADGAQLYAWKGGEEPPVALDLILDTVYSNEEGGNEAGGPEGDAAEENVPLENEGEESEKQPEENSQANLPHLDYSFIIGDGERLLSFNRNTGVVSELVVEGKTVTPKPVVTLQLPEEEQNLEYGDMTAYAVHGGKLIFTRGIHGDEGQQRKRPLLVGDLSTGEVKTIPVDYAVNAVAYKGDSILLVAQNYESAYDRTTQESRKPDYVVYNLSTGEAAAPAPLPENVSQSGMAYLPDADAVVYLNRGKIMELVNGLKDVKQVGYTTMDYANRIGLLSDGTLGIHGYNGISISTINQNFDPGEFLTVYGGNMDQGTIAFTKKYPQVPVYASDNYYSSMTDMAAALSSGEPIDVLRMGLSFSPFEQMKRKGYCADLSGDGDIVSFVEKLYPFAKTHCMKDGQVVAVPSNAWFSSESVSENIMEEMGLKKEDIPSNMVDLCEFITRWNDDFAEDYPNYMPIEVWEGPLKKAVLSMILEKYSLYQEYMGQPPTFDTPLFRELMNAWQQMRTDELDRAIKRASSGDEMYLEPLIMNYGGGFADAYSNKLDRPLSLTADTPALYEMNCSYTFINPKTKHMNYALDLVKCYLDNMSGESQYLLLSTKTEPLENPNYADSINGIERWIKDLEKNLAKASEDEKRELEDQLQDARKELEDAKNRKYSISAEKLENYKTNVVPYAVMRAESLWNFSDKSVSSEISSILARLSDGDMSVDQFITEMDGKLRMIQLENQ